MSDGPFPKGRDRPGAAGAEGATAGSALPAAGSPRIPARDPSASLAAAGLAAAVAAALAELAAGPGTRMGWWPFRTGFEILRWAAYAGVAAAALSFAAGLGARPGSGRRGGVRVAVAGLLVGLAAAGVPWGYLRVAKSVPAIHDVTTDTENPPSFTALLPIRQLAPNGAAYGGPDVAARQRDAYPDVRPVVLGVPPAEAFERALAAARRMDWEIAAADRSRGEIEATATTFWFGFKDDVVVRVAPEGSGSRVDVRSVSRVGIGDLGANARRIRKYLAALPAA